MRWFTALVILVLTTIVFAEALRYRSIFSEADQKVLENDLGKDYVARFEKSNNKWSYRGPICRALTPQCIEQYHLDRLNAALRRMDETKARSLH
jgi:hypothetical protein